MRLLPCADGTKRFHSVPITIQQVCKCVRGSHGEQHAKRLREVVARRGDVVSRWVRCGSQRRQTDEAFRAAYDELDRALAAIGTSNTKSMTTKIVKIVGPGT